MLIIATTVMTLFMIEKSEISIKVLEMNWEFIIQAHNPTTVCKLHLQYV